MKKLLILLAVAFCALSANAQMNTFGGIGLRVNDTTTYQTNAAAYHTAGYRDIYFNNQAATKHFDIWNGSSYDHVFSWGGGGSPRGLPRVSATGSVFSFAIPQIYGLSGDITGNITFSTTGAVIGMEQHMIHNDTVEPSFPSEFKRMEGSRAYVTNADNIIITTYYSSTRILYTINQEQ